MQVFRAGEQVQYEVSLGLHAGAVDAVSYRVIDEFGSELLAKVALAAYVPGTDLAHITIPAELNALPLAATRGLRMIELFLETAAGVVVETASYLIESGDPLVEGVNSASAYPMSLFVSSEMSSLESWLNASRPERIVALLEAWRKFSAVRFSNCFDVRRLTVNEWNGLHPDFRLALRRAQVAEADAILGGDEMEGLRASGVMSMTVGESSQFFRTTKPIQAPLCKRAMTELRGYLSNRIAVGRA